MERILVLKTSKYVQHYSNFFIHLQSNLPTPQWVQCVPMIIAFPFFAFLELSNHEKSRDNQLAAESSFFFATSCA